MVCFLYSQAKMFSSYKKSKAALLNDILIKHILGVAENILLPKAKYCITYYIVQFQIQKLTLLAI